MGNKVGRRRLKMIGVWGSAVLFVLVGISYARALLAPDSPGWDMRTAEWLRDSHLGWALDLAEWTWLNVHGPSAEELLPTQLSSFPKPFDRPGSSEPSREPPPIEPVLDQPLEGEGQWEAVGVTVNGVPTLRRTYFRPDRDCDVSVAVTRFTPKLSRFVLVPGTRDPGGEWRWHGKVPKSEQPNLLAAFNSGYRLRDAHGGMYVEGTVARPLKNGAASLVIDDDGDLDIMAWTAGETLPPGVTAVRQNLRLLVENGKVRVSAKKKCTNGIDHSGLGITRDGALLYVVGHRLTRRLVAQALQHAGAERGMELDAHTVWQSFNVYQPSQRGDGTIVATKLNKDMRLPATRYLTPDDRDFVAAFVR